MESAGPSWKKSGGRWQKTAPSMGRHSRHDLRGDLNRQRVPSPPGCTVGAKLEANGKFGSREPGSKKIPSIKGGSQPGVQVGYL